MSQYSDFRADRYSIERGREGEGEMVVGRFMNAVYAWMCVGLALTAVVAWYVAQNPQNIKTIFSSGLILPLVIGQLALVWIVTAAVNRVSASLATVLFLIYSGLNGVLLSSIFYRYSQASITSAFVVSAGTFGVVSLYGFFTKRNLSSLGGMMFMALIGLIIASVVNMFFANSMLYWIITYAGVLIFVGLTAYDTQKLKMMAMQTQGNAAMSSRMAIVGSLILYLDFINLFLYILRILGDRRQ